MQSLLVLSQHRAKCIVAGTTVQRLPCMSSLPQASHGMSHVS